MNFLQRWLSRLIDWCILRQPPQVSLSESFHQANVSLRNKQVAETLRLANAELVLAKRQQESSGEWRKQAIREEQAELRQALDLIGGGWVRPDMKVVASTAESLAKENAPAGVVKCVERLWDLELALEDRGWVRELTLSNFEFSLFGVHRIIALCRLYKIKNPLIRRGIQVSSFYVFGRGVTITADDAAAQKVIDAFFTNPRNISQVGHRGLVAKEESIWTDGNLYMVFFRDAVDGDLIIRTFDPIEIVEIVTDPDDSSEERYFHRRWMAQNFDLGTGTPQPKMEEAWYPAMGYDPADKPTTIGSQNIPIRWDEPVLHEKEGGLEKWLWGIPLAYPAIDYARAVKRLIDNWCSIQEAMARFAWQVETQGGLPAIANLKQNFATTLANGGDSYEQNPPPVTASTWISGPGNKLTMSKTSGMIDSPEIGRRVAHFVYMVFGLPETFFADASVGTVATATSLDRPTELKFLEAQERWREVLQRICQFVLLSSNEAPLGKLREANKDKPKKDVTIKVAFPSILEHDIGAQIDAIIAAATMNGFEVTGIDQRLAVGLLLQELGVEDWQDVLELMYPESEYEDLMDRTPLLAKQEEDALAPPQPAMPGVGGNTGTPTPTPVDDKNPATAAPPFPPKAKTAKPRRVTPAESLKLQRAVAALTRVAANLKEQGRR